MPKAKPASEKDAGEIKHSKLKKPIKEKTLGKRTTKEKREKEDDGFQ